MSFSVPGARARPFAKVMIRGVSVYLVVNAHITDPVRFAEYRSAVGATFVGHEVERLASRDDAAIIEGDPIGTRVVLLRFPDRDAAMAWYNSDAYRQVIDLRLSSTQGSMLLVDGLS